MENLGFAEPVLNPYRTRILPVPPRIFSWGADGLQQPLFSPDIGGKKIRNMNMAAGLPAAL